MLIIRTFAAHTHFPMMLDRSCQNLKCEAHLYFVLERCLEGQEGLHVQIILCLYTTEEHIPEFILQIKPRIIKAVSELTGGLIAIIHWKIFQFLFY